MINNVFTFWTLQLNSLIFCSRLSKVSFYIHQELDYELFHALSNLRLLRSVKWSLNFYESGSFTYNCCIFSLTSFPKLRSLKIVHTKFFSLEIELLDLLTSSRLKKFHLNADNVRVDRSCENCAFLIPNRTLRDLKIQVNNYSLISNQFNEIGRFMRILLRAFEKLTVLQCTPVKDTVMEDIIQYQVSQLPKP